MGGYGDNENGAIRMDRPVAFRCAGVGYSAVYSVIVMGRSVPSEGFRSLPPM